MLTMLGVVIGVMSVIVVFVVAESAQALLGTQLASLGPDVILVANGRGDDARRAGPDPFLKQVLTYRDYQHLKEQPWVAAANATIISDDVLTVGGTSVRAHVVGSTPDEPVLFHGEIALGRYLVSDDLASRSRVMVLGSSIAQRLFGYLSSIGERVRVHGQTYRVVGVMRPAGTRFFNDVNEQVYVPVTTAMDQYQKDRVTFLALRPRDVSVSMTVERVRVELRTLHGIVNPRGDHSKDDFRIATQEDVQRRVGLIGSLMRVLLGSIAALALFVAGMGIMNMMYVHVAERTQEIGLRKALGAHPYELTLQFLCDAFFLSVLGSTIGTVVGVVCSWLLIQRLALWQEGWIFILPWKATAAIWFFATVWGVVCGMAPARAAGRRQAIEALYADT